MIPHFKKSVALLSMSLLMSCSGDSGTDTADLPVLEITPFSIEEGDDTTTTSIHLSLSKPSDNPVTAVVTMSSGTAQSGEDFVRSNLPIDIQPGELNTSVEMEITGDSDYEADETFNVRLVSVSGAIAGESVQMTLVNDDPHPMESLRETLTSLLSALNGPTSPETYEGMDLIWQDEFDGTVLDNEKWTEEFGDNWFNEELQTYTNGGRNQLVDQGHLVIEAREEKSPYGGDNPYTSARLITQNKFDFTHGRVDIRAAMPEGQGIWPALWTLGSSIATDSWPACGEIDILEMIGGEEIPSQKGETVVHNALHWQNASGSHQTRGSHYNLPSGSLHGEFHVYSIEWTEESISYFIDGTLRDVQDITADHMSEFRAPHFFIMNIAVGGTWPGNPDHTTSFPQRMFVDYIRVFQTK